VRKHRALLKHNQVQPTLNLLKSVLCSILRKHPRDAKSFGVALCMAGKLFQHCMSRLEKKYLRISLRNCCTKKSEIVSTCYCINTIYYKKADTSVSIIPNNILYTKNEIKTQQTQFKTVLSKFSQPLRVLQTTTTQETFCKSALNCFNFAYLTNKIRWPNTVDIFK